MITEAEKKLATLETKVAELERVKVAAEDAYSAAFDEAEAKINAEYEEKCVCYRIALLLRLLSGVLSPC